MEKVLRIVPSEVTTETRADGKKYISYYAIVFNNLSRNMGGWYERILPEAVREADFTEWCAKKNHDTNQLLGANWSGTATYEIDARGVKATVLIGDSPTWQNTISEIERGDLRSASFEFTPDPEGMEWKREMLGDVEVKVCDVHKIRKVWDLSPVAVPAYPATAGIDMIKRSFEEHQAQDIETEAAQEEAAPDWETELMAIEAEI